MANKIPSLTDIGAWGVYLLEQLVFAVLKNDFFHFLTERGRIGCQDIEQ